MTFSIAIGILGMLVLCFSMQGGDFIMASVMCFSMQHEDIIEHTIVKSHFCTL